MSANLVNLLEGRAREELIELAKTYRWWHAIDLGGFVTSGVRSPLVASAFGQIDFRGKKVLDIGCWDGLWSFEAEERGAREVYSTDYVSLRSWSEQPTYQLAHKARGSKALYYPNVSVHDVGRLGVSDFDIVIYCGIYYHLRDPLRAFTALRDVMAEGGLIVVEGPVLDGSDEVFANFYGQEWFSEDPTNWWVPTIPCLREWLDCSFFDVVSELSTKRDLPAGPAVPAGQPPATRRHPSPVRAAARRIRSLFGFLRTRPRAPAPPPATETDRYLVVARATSVSEKLAERLKGKGAAPLLAAPGVTPERVAGFSAAAAEFRTRRPWQGVRSDVTIKVECATLGRQPAFLLVLGAGRGLALYFDRGWLTMTLQGSLPGRVAWAPMLAVIYCAEADLPAGDADALKASGWNAADGVYPFAVWNEAYAEKTRQVGNTLRRPDANQLELLEACCQAVPAFIERHGTGGSAVEDVSVPVAGGEMKVTLSWMTEGSREL